MDRSTNKLDGVGETNAFVSSFPTVFSSVIMPSVCVRVLVSFVGPPLMV